MTKRLVMIVVAVCLASCGDKETASSSKSAPANSAAAPKRTEKNGGPAEKGTRKSVAVAAESPVPANADDASEAIPSQPDRAPPTPAPVYRPSDSRPRHDDAALEKAGIRKHASRRLLLYTDIDDTRAASLPPLMDLVYEAWEEYFGPLPRDREGTNFQMTGYIMADRERFLSTGLLPQDLPGFLHGRHRGAEFWMNDQTADYYLQHLMLHEGTHCFMTIVPAPMGNAIWYMEGMAELFGTHTLAPDGSARFRVFPGERDQFPGLGRIRMVREEVRAGRLLGLEALFAVRGQDFAKNALYAWSWALCEFLDSHPRYQERFRHISEHVAPDDPRAGFVRTFEEDWTDLSDEWQLFAQGLCHGYDVERAVIQFAPGQPVAGKPATATIAADRGWQSSGVQLDAGHTYRITAEGRFTLAQEPKPWESEAQGVSIRYCEGRPLGLLLGTIRHATAGDEPSSMRNAFAVGRELVITPEATGTLYLRINEFWNELADNTGELNVTVEKQAESK